MKIIADCAIPMIKNYFSHCGELLLIDGNLIDNNVVQDADILIVRSVTRVDADLLHNSKIKIVASVTTGIDHLDIAWLHSQNIKWYASCGYNAIAVADYVFATVAAVCHNSVELPNWRIGIIGVGRIGSIVAERFKQLGCKVLLYDLPRAAWDEKFANLAVAQLPLADLDLITIHVPLTQGCAYQTQHLIDEQFLSQLAPDTVLINTSRGAVVDFNALQQFERVRYCFDVWEHEPRIDLAALELTEIATPHVAGHSLQNQYRGIAMVYDFLCREKFIAPGLAVKVPPVPQQTLSFDNRLVSWQEVILSVFDPVVLTQLMKSVLCAAPLDNAACFKQLRQSFIGNNIKRHEFNCTRVEQVNLTPFAQHIVQQLNIKIA